ncbi:hypothetical protein J2X31_002107 [Flavobacterium arsenatis]|uniref:Uncharacterized protein n=1 Tax=Flavobacterium arsenatis TaxID=1484332 RepID=A0ABU1TR78_9FLAO|nr:hypothetical protein [Flavobacterium arsenatis]MDR6968092.1 hypothetical protein [Flavobacterium arsenatis]
MKNLSILSLLLLIDAFGFQENLNVEKQTFIKKDSKIQQIDYKNSKTNEVKINYRRPAFTENSKAVLLKGYATYLDQYKKIVNHLMDGLHLMTPDFTGYTNNDLPYPKNYEYTFGNSEKKRSPYSELKDSCPHAKNKTGLWWPYRILERQHRIKIVGTFEKKR